MFVDGEYIDYVFQTEPEPLGALAHVQVFGDVLEFRDVALYCGAGMPRVNLGVGELEAIAARGRVRGAGRRLRVSCNQWNAPYRRESSKECSSQKAIVMIRCGPLVIDEELGKSTRAVFDAEGEQAAVAHLRLAGEGKIGSIKVLVRACGLSLREAKATVHFSPTWSDRQQADDEFHEQLAVAVSLMNAEEERERSDLRKAS